MIESAGATLASAQKLSMNLSQTMFSFVISSRKSERRKYRIQEWREFFSFFFHALSLLIKGRDELQEKVPHSICEGEFLFKSSLNPLRRSP